MKKPNIIFEKRHIVISIFIVIAMFFYILRLFSMQIIDTYIYEQQADEISRREKIIPAKRGEIFDRNFDQPIVTNIDSFTIFLDLTQVATKGLDQLVNDLALLLNTQPDYLWENISGLTSQGLRKGEIWNSASFRQVSSIAEQIEHYNGISWESRPARYYPEGESMAHLLGYVGKISSEELKLFYNKGYASAREIGKSGVEKQYDDILRGEDGISYSRFDARGRQIIELEEDTPPKLGQSIVLTIDRHIQLLAEKALGKRTGAVVVMNPKNGEILALVSYPSFDPNIFSIGVERQIISSIQRDPQSPLLNRSIQASASPASTFKILMSVAVHAEKAFDPFNRIYCRGSIWVGNREFKCHEELGHGYVNLYTALAESCNVYFYTMGKNYLGIDVIHDYSLLFGLGELTRVDLPNEQAGLLPTPEWKESTQNIPWTTGDTVNISIGQGFLSVTPMQLSNIVAGVYNDGIIYQPHLLKEIRNQRSLELIQENEPRVFRETGIDTNVFKEVRSAMRLVVTDGTPQSVLTTEVETFAGKTGTAERGGDNEPDSWFTSYFSTQDQAYVVTVWVDGFNEWEWWAPKAANIIVHGIANDLSYEEVIRDILPRSYYLRSSDLGDI